MIKVICDKCEEEIIDLNEISAVVEDGIAKHYHKTACFVEARDTLQSTSSSPANPI